MLLMIEIIYVLGFILGLAQYKLLVTVYPCYPFNTRDVAVIFINRCDSIDMDR